MNIPETTLEIQTLGRFKISICGKTVATDWPNEMLKVLFCSLLSPLDLNFTWDRISRSMLNVPATQTSRRKIKELYIRHLNSFLINEFGFSPLVVGPEGIRIDHKGIHEDALEFYNTVLEGHRLLSISDHSAAFEKLNKANALYTGCYLPGIPGKIITNTRIELETLYRTAVMNAKPLIK